MRCAWTIAAWALGFPLAMLGMIALAMGGPLLAMKGAEVLGAPEIVGLVVWSFVSLGTIGGALGASQCRKRR